MQLSIAIWKGWVVNFLRHAEYDAKLIILQGTMRKVQACGHVTEAQEFCFASDPRISRSPRRRKGSYRRTASDERFEKPILDAWFASATPQVGMAWRVFYSYSHRNADLREQLSTFLAPLRHQERIVEWYDRKIEPGADWRAEISERLQSAHLILLLVSEDFLASDYCFGVEANRAITRLKCGEAKVVPILLKPCLWKESRFSELQIIPRDGTAITSKPSLGEAFVEVATEISELTSEPPPSPAGPIPEYSRPKRFDSSLDLVHDQVRSYANLYERIRQRMRSSPDRTQRMSLKIAQAFEYQGNDWWKWSVWVEGTDPELAQIDYVVYKLHPTFPRPVRTVGSRATNFRLNAHGWGVFPIRASVIKKNGESIPLKHDLVLEYPDGKPCTK